MNRRTTLTALLLLSVAFAAFAGDASPPAVRLANPFFAMDTGTRDAAHPGLDSQIRMLQELGYAGFGGTFQSRPGVREMLSAVEQHGLKLFTLYAALDVVAGKSTVPPPLAEAIAALSGRDTILWLTVQNGSLKSSAPEGDPAAVAALREIAALAATAHVRIALYPHTGTWLERVDDAVRLADKVDRENLGATFNLCHWLMVDGQDLEGKLKRALPRLFVVTLNGADAGGKDWGRLIKPLDQGSYDVRPLLATLAKLGYTGPVGLQHFGVGGSAEDNLRHSMEAWRKYSGQTKP